MKKSRLIFTFLYILIFPILLLFISGNWLWIQGIIFSFWFIFLCYGTIIYLYRNDPALLEERYQKPGTGGEKGWDVYVVYTLVLMFFLWFIIMPLDAERFKWSINFPLWIEVVGGFLLLVSAFFFFKSYMDNTFLSPLVRIQAERKQKVVSNGLYGIIRHPLYLGGILLFIGTPLLLGSFFGLIIGLFLIFLIMGRIIGEEKMLEEELDGYSEYKKEVRYRLIPYLW
jgi:protein-S-isoprenylcysteine O-methyltransferase Ste14